MTWGRVSGGLAPAEFELSSPGGGGNSIEVEATLALLELLSFCEASAAAAALDARYSNELVTAGGVDAAADVVIWHWMRHITPIVTIRIRTMVRAETRMSRSVLIGQRPGEKSGDWSKPWSVVIMVSCCCFTLPEMTCSPFDAGSSSSPASEASSSPAI